jgi:RNA polymerase sigma-70 factor (ECF subfamily)
MEQSDFDIAEQVRQGEHQAFRLLVERHSRALFRLTYRMTANEQDAEDLVQETFLRAFKQLHCFDGRAAFATWLHRIAANCALDLLRARKNRERSTVTQSAGQEFDLLDATPAGDPSPERLTHSTEIARLLRPAMAQLSEMERAAFVMRHHEGMGIEEIGRTLGVLPNAAKHSVFRAVQKLRHALQPALELAQR